MRHNRKSKSNHRRYRENKFSKKEIANNVKIPGNWLAPSVKSKFDRIVQEIEFIKTILPITNIHLKKKEYI
jgi:hypothetical protein